MINSPPPYRSPILLGIASLAFFLSVHEISSQGRRLMSLKRSRRQL